MFEEIKKELIKQVPGTTAIFLETSSKEVYLNVTYKPLELHVKVPYCEDLELLRVFYIKQLMIAIDVKIEYSKRTIESLEYFKHTFDSVLPPHSTNEDN